MKFWRWIRNLEIIEIQSREIRRQDSTIKQQYAKIDSQGEEITKLKEMDMETQKTLNAVHVPDAKALFLALMDVPNLETVGIELPDGRDVRAFELVERTLTDKSTTTNIRFLPFVNPISVTPGCEQCGSGFLTTQDDTIVCDACGHEHKMEVVNDTTT